MSYECLGKRPLLKTVTLPLKPLVKLCKLQALAVFERCMPQTAPADSPQQTQATAEVVLRHHLCWKHRDLDGVMAHYHPDIQYHDFFQNRVVCFDQLREYLQASMPRDPDEGIEHTDRICTDGDTAFTCSCRC